MESNPNNTTISAIVWRQNQNMITDMFNFLRSCNIYTSKSEIRRCFEDREFIAKMPEREVAKMLTTFAAGYFGTDPDKSGHIIELALIELHGMQNVLTVTDIRLAYANGNIEKRQGVALTIGEFMEPIRKAYKRKLSIKEAYTSQKDKNDADGAKKRQFEDSAWEVLKSSANRGEWQGSIYHANIIARDIAHLVPEERRNEISKTMVLPYFEQYNRDNLVPAPKPIFCYANLVVIECIQQHNEALIKLIESR